MNALSSVMAQNLQSLQQAISMSTLKMSMNADAASSVATIAAMEQANPVAPPTSAMHRIDVLA